MHRPGLSTLISTEAQMNGTPASATLNQLSVVQASNCIKVDVVVTCLTILCTSSTSHHSEWLSFQATFSRRNHLSLAGEEENGRGPLNIHRAVAQWMEMSERGWKKRRGGDTKKNSDWNRMPNCKMELAAWHRKQLILQMLIIQESVGTFSKWV